MMMMMMMMMIVIKQKVVSQGHSFEGVGEWCSCLGQQCARGSQAKQIV
jgi:hypothetical protein